MYKSSALGRIKATISPTFKDILSQNMFVTDYCCFIGLVLSDRGSPIRCQPQGTARIFYSIQSIIFHLLTHIMEQ